MTLNPYEPPQTTDAPLPIATTVHQFVRTREGLIRAAALLVDGGRLQFAAGLAGILAVLLIMQGRDPNQDELLQRLMLLVAMVVTGVLWMWGAIKNCRGYTAMANYVTQEGIQNLYVLCQIQWWVQLVVTLLLIFVPPALGRDANLIASGLLALLLLSQLASTIAQTTALRYWIARFELQSSAGLYRAGGVAVAICLGLLILHTFLHWRSDGALYVVLALLLAITAWDFAQRYHVIHQELLDEATRDESV